MYARRLSASRKPQKHLFTGQEAAVCMYELSWPRADRINAGVVVAESRANPRRQACGAFRADTGLTASLGGHGGELGAESSFPPP